MLILVLCVLSFLLDSVVFKYIYIVLVVVILEH